MCLVINCICHIHEIKKAKHTAFVKCTQRTLDFDELTKNHTSCATPTTKTLPINSSSECSVFVSGFGDFPVKKLIEIHRFSLSTICFLAFSLSAVSTTPSKIATKTRFCQFCCINSNHKLFNKTIDGTCCYSYEFYVFSHYTVKH